MLEAAVGGAAAQEEIVQDAPPARPAQFPLQEVLRTLGAGLEAAKARRAEVVVDPDGVSLFAPGEYGQRRYDWDEIDSQSRAQQALRRPGNRPPPWMDPWALSRWSVLLRVAGLLLDAQGVRACTIEATVAPAESAEESRLTVTAAGREVLDGAALREHVKWLRLRRGTRYVPEPPVVKRPWWAPWRRA
jgi:hypothetical protein